jgi:transcriptional regulator with XRE-family HTH domain
MHHVREFRRPLEHGGEAIRCVPGEPMPRWRPGGRTVTASAGALGAPEATRRDSATAQDWQPQLRELGQYIRLQRQLADLSLRRMAEMTQVSNAYLSQIERGLHLPSLRVLRSIADALDVSADTLLAQAGLADAEAPEGEPGPARNTTEDAILSDPDLTPEERQALLTVYRGLKQRRAET